MSIEHPGEAASNDLRRRLAAVEPVSLRTYTPSLAVIAASEGCYHFTPEGKKLADFTSGVLVANLGHNPPAWWQRVWQYMGLPVVGHAERAENRTASGGTQSVPYAAPLTSYNALTPLEVAASERLVANLRAQPGGRRMEHVLWAASGSEAIQKALWCAMARGTPSGPPRDMILATRAGFHGKKGLAGAITGTERDPHRDPRVRFISFPTDDCISVQRRRQPIDLAPYEAELAALWSEYGERIGCLCTEPYLGGAGSYHPQPEYLQLLARFCREHDIVFILDEIQSCFGRTGPMYAFSQYGVEPDIVVLGKGLGNGVPVSAAVGRADILGSLTYGQTSDTFSGNPLACAAVMATLDEFESTDVLANVPKLAQTIEQGLLKLTELPGVAHIRGEGAVWGIECSKVGDRAANDLASDFIQACYRGDAQGRAIHLLGPLAGKVIRVSPPLVMPITEAREYLASMHDIFRATTSNSS
jgi:4-aminobutyrate aminotransferase-like enzyme